jgi:hypothetical protein
VVRSLESVCGALYIPHPHVLHSLQLKRPTLVWVSYWRLFLNLAVVRDLLPPTIRVVWTGYRVDGSLMSTFWRAINIPFLSPTLFSWCSFPPLSLYPHYVPRLFCPSHFTTEYPLGSLGYTASYSITIDSTRRSLAAGVDTRGSGVDFSFSQWFIRSISKSLRLPASLI